MTPIEKAQEFVNKMFKCDQYTPEESMAMIYPHALQCALIAVDEILENFNKISKDLLSCDYQPYSHSNYWQEVKHELVYMYSKQLTK
jgi:hypothetical protein